MTPRELELARAPVDGDTGTLLAPDPVPAVARAGGVAFVGVGLYRVAGLGLPAAVTEAQVMAIENVYADRGVAFEVLVSPLAHFSVAEVLSKRGYRILRFDNVMSGPKGCAAVKPGSDRERELAAAGYKLEYTAVALGRGAL